MVAVDPILALAVAIADASREMQDLWVVHHMLSTARPGFVWQFAGPCCDFFKVFEWLIEQRTCIHVAYECQDNSTGLRSEPFRFLEIGVGGGYIALRVLHRFPNMQYIGVDPMEHSVIGTHWSRHGHAWDVDWDVDMLGLRHWLGVKRHGQK